MVVQNAKRTIRLLKQVIQSIKKVPRRKFNMSHWWGTCDTTGCAIGWWIHDHPRGCLAFEYVPSTQTIQIYHKKSGSFGYYAVAECFGITYDHAMFLFMRGWHESPTNRQIVIKRIGKYIDYIKHDGNRIASW